MQRRFTCENLPVDFVSVEDWCGDASHGADHASQAQINQHEKKHDGPEWTGREVGHGFCEGNECQAGALNCLHDGEKKVKRVKVVKLVDNVLLMLTGRCGKSLVIDKS